jgi:hypothetical protein
LANGQSQCDRDLSPENKDGCVYRKLKQAQERRPASGLDRRINSVADLHRYDGTKDGDKGD